MRSSTSSVPVDVAAAGEVDLGQQHHGRCAGLPGQRKASLHKPRPPPASQRHDDEHGVDVGRDRLGDRLATRAQPGEHRAAVEHRDRGFAVERNPVTDRRCAEFDRPNCRGRRGKTSPRAARATTATPVSPAVGAVGQDGECAAIDARNPRRHQRLAKRGNSKRRVRALSRRQTPACAATT